MQIPFNWVGTWSWKTIHYYHALNIISVHCNQTSFILNILRWFSVPRCQNGHFYDWVMTTITAWLGSQLFLSSNWIFNAKMSQYSISKVSPRYLIVLTHINFVLHHNFFTEISFFVCDSKDPLLWAWSEVGYVVSSLQTFDVTGSAHTKNLSKLKLYTPGHCLVPTVCLISGEM